MLEVRDVRKAFGELQVLKGIDLKVDKGDVVAILGSSGSGKTTLLRCIRRTSGGSGRRQRLCFRVLISLPTRRPSRM